MKCSLYGNVVTWTVYIARMSMLVSVLKKGKTERAAPSPSVHVSHFIRAWPSTPCRLGRSRMSQRPGQLMGRLKLRRDSGSQGKHFVPESEVDWGLFCSVLSASDCCRLSSSALAFCSHPLAALPLTLTSLSVQDPAKARWQDC